MKKKLILFMVITISMGLTSLQIATAQSWLITGNNNTTALSKLGTTNFIPLNLVTNNLTRVRIDELGRVGIGNKAPVNILTVQQGGGTPAASWLNGLNSPIYMGFAEGVSSEFVLAAANALSTRRAVIQGRRSRGTLAAPTAVVNNDFITSVLASAHDGTSFQNPATIDFFVDGVPSAGHVPARISFVTGTNSGDRLERLKVGSTGNFTFNTNQIFLRQSDGNVGIGTVAPTNKLHVVGTSLFTAKLNVSGGGITATNTGTGVYGNSSAGLYGVWGNSTYLGVYGTGTDYGVYGYGTVGVSGQTSDSTGYGVSGNGYTGVYGNGSYAGVWGDGSSYGGVFFGGPYGVWAEGSSYAGYFSGNVHATGLYSGSDRSLKKNIKEFTSAMDIINKLKPRQYEFRHDGNYEKMNLPTGNHYGLIAQDVEEILPNLVQDTKFETNFTKKPFVVNSDPGKPAPLDNTTNTKSDPISYKALNYIELIPIIIKGMQEQEVIIEKLSAINEDLKNQINELKSLILQGNNGTSITSLSGYLKQNTPNPAANNTIISYYLPDNIRNAQIKITDMKGSVLKAYSAPGGAGQVNIRSGELPAGVYNYTLYANNKKLDTKKMVIMK